MSLVNFFEARDNLTRRSATLKESRERLKKSQEVRQQAVSTQMNLTRNIEYWKEHGTLPKNTDMQSIQGKGEAYEHKRV